MIDDAGRYVVQSGFGEDSFVELWDTGAEPQRLAFLMIAPEEGPVTIVGYENEVPFDVFERFLALGREYLGEYIAAMPPTE
jgi:hypothetical protein